MSRKGKEEESSVNQFPIEACKSPERGAPPDQFLDFLRQIVSEKDPQTDIDDLDLESETASAHVTGSVLASFKQAWSLEDVYTGDLVSSISMAPGEVLTMELRRTQHTLLEENREQASTVEEGTEKLNSDKESITIANTSARTANWGISATGGFSIDGIGASGSYTDNHTINTSTMNTINEIHETTVKSTQKITTQTKIQVRGVTETTLEARQTRIIKNPFLDRTLDLNLYEILKKFLITTSQVELTDEQGKGTGKPKLALMITVDFNPLDFSENFISANLPFLQDALIDPQLKDALPAIAGILRQAGAEDPQLIKSALDALEQTLYGSALTSIWHFELDHKGVMTWDVPYFAFVWENQHRDDLNIVAPNIIDEINGWRIRADFVAYDTGYSAFQLWLTLQDYFFKAGGNFPPGQVNAGKNPPYRMVDWPQDHLDFDPTYVNNRQSLMVGLAEAVKTIWNSDGLTDQNRKDLMKSNTRTEVFRRIPKFLSLYESFKDLLKGPDDQLTASLLQALKNHLQSHRYYYTGQYIRYLWEKFGRIFLVKLANDILATLFPSPPYSNLTDTCKPYLSMYSVADVERDGLCLLIPVDVDALLEYVKNHPDSTDFVKELGNNNGGLIKAINGAELQAPRQGEVVVPAEGIHLEPVPGICPPLQIPPGGENGSDNGKDGNDDGHGNQ